MLLHETFVGVIHTCRCLLDNNLNIILIVGYCQKKKGWKPLLHVYKRTIAFNCGIPVAVTCLTLFTSGDFINELMKPSWQQYTHFNKLVQIHGCPHKDVMLTGIPRCLLMWQERSRNHRQPISRSLRTFSLPVACIIYSNGSQASVCIRITLRVVKTQITRPLPEVLIQQVWSGTENGHP